MKAKPCNLKGFYKPVYYEIVSQEYRHRSELKKKAKSFGKQNCRQGQWTKEEKKNKMTRIEYFCVI